MRLIDLCPRWLSPDVFTFLCPHCCRALLTCKRTPMKGSEQAALWREQLGWDEEDQDVAWGSVIVVLCKAETAWTFSGVDFETLTVFPSLDASASGHWHGFITGGQIVGGEILKV